MKHLFLASLALIFHASHAFAVNYRDFGDCTTNGTRFTYAPEWLNNRHCSAHTSNDYVNARWWPVTDCKPICATNEYAEAIGWAKYAVDNTREQIDWMPTDPPQTNEWGEVIWIPVTNIVHYTTYRIERQYTVKPIPPPPFIPRKFSKLKIYGAIIALPNDANGTTAWAKIQAWLEAKTINGVNGWMAFQLAQEISEDHPLFAPLAEEARTLLGLTTAQFDALLNACILEP